jgi:hypothetical protein
VALLTVVVVGGYSAGRRTVRPPASIAVAGTFAPAPQGIALRGDLLVVTLPPGGCPQPVELRRRDRLLTVRVVDPYPGMLCELAEEPQTFAVRVGRDGVRRVLVDVSSRDRPATREYTVDADGRVRPVR